VSSAVSYGSSRTVWYELPRIGPVIPNPDGVLVVETGIPFSCCINFSLVAGEEESRLDCTNRPARTAATKNAKMAMVLFIIKSVERKLQNGFESSRKVETHSRWTTSLSSNSSSTLRSFASSNTTS
jgi:hypothetical protein